MCKHHLYLLLVTALFVGCGPTKSSIQKAEKAEKRKPVVITFDDVKLNIEEDMVFEDSMLTDRVRELDGKYVRVRGFICAETTFQQTDIKQFILIRDYSCKFGPGGQFHHNMMVELEPDDAIDFTTRPVTVEGKLTLDPKEGPNGKTWSIYRLKG